MKKKRITVIASILILGVIAFMQFIYPSLKADTNIGSIHRTARSNILPVEAYIVNAHGVTDVYPVVSVLNPSENVDLSFETSGRITEILFEEGALVKKDQLLAKVNDARLQAQLKRQQAQLTLYKSKEFRQKSLLEMDAVSQQAYDESNTAVEIAEADIELLKAQIRETELRAPFDGFVGLRRVSEGAYATPATIIAKLTKISPLKMELSVPEKFVGMVKPGTDIFFHIDDDTTEYKAQVYAIDAESTALHMYTVRAYFPNIGGKIPPGHYASISLPLSYSKDGISVPAEAVVAELGRQIVYKVNRNKAHKVAVELGIRTAASVQVLGGLNVGDTILTTGIMQLREGLEINITNIRKK
jgi:membrane fusion protein (multidrug efflux system)